LNELLGLCWPATFVEKGKREAVRTDKFVSIAEPSQSIWSVKASTSQYRKRLIVNRVREVSRMPNVSWHFD